MDLEAGIEDKIRNSQPKKKISPIALLQYKIGIYTCIVLWTSAMYGAFTNGLPPRFTYAYVLPSIFFQWQKIEYLKEILCHRLKIIQFSILDVCYFLHEHPCSVFVLLSLIIWQLIVIILYHT